MEAKFGAEITGLQRTIRNPLLIVRQDKDMIRDGRRVWRVH
jgi:hypothetical protein